MVTRAFIVNLCRKTRVSCGLLPRRNLATVIDEKVVNTPNNIDCRQNSEEPHVNQEVEIIKEKNEDNINKSDHISFNMPTIHLPAELDSALRTVLAST